MNDRFKVSTLLARRLGEHQVSLPALLRRAGLPAGFFQQEKIYVTTAELFALWQAIGETSADPGIGLKLGAEPRFERYQPSAIAAVCSRSFRDALQRIGRYKQLTCPEEIRVHTTGDEAAVEFFYLQAEEIQPDVLVDLGLSWLLAIGRRGTDGQITPLRLELTRPVQHRELLESHFGCRVRFKALRNALVFRNSDLDQPFVTQNEELLKAIGAQLEAELQERTASTDVGEQVKHTLKRSLAGKRPTLQQVARELCMSVRTLQRRLTAGCGLVQRWGGPIEQIRPGDVVWFPPAEKHWHGATPTTAMTHIAIVEHLNGKSADWMEKVSDEQYQQSQRNQ